MFSESSWARPKVCRRHALRVCEPCGFGLDTTTTERPANSPRSPAPGTDDETSARWTSDSFEVDVLSGSTFEEWIVVRRRPLLTPERVSRDEMLWSGAVPSGLPEPFYPELQYETLWGRQQPGRSNNAEAPPRYSETARQTRQPIGNSGIAEATRQPARDSNVAEPARQPAEDTRSDGATRQPAGNSNVAEPARQPAEGTRSDGATRQSIGNSGIAEATRQTVGHSVVAEPTRQRVGRNDFLGSRSISPRWNSINDTLFQSGEQSSNPLQSPRRGIIRGVTRQPAGHGDAYLGNPFQDNLSAMTNFLTLQIRRPRQQTARA